MIDASLFMIGWEAGNLYMIGWGAGPCYVILQEEGFLPMSELSGLLLLKFPTSTHTTEIQKECLFMITLIGLDGAPEVCPDHRRDKSRGCVRQRHWKMKEGRFPEEGSGQKFGMLSEGLMMDSDQSHRLHLLI